MRLKMRQPNQLAKNFILPSIKSVQQDGYHPRHKQINKSLPKIVATNFDQRIQSNHKQVLKTEPSNYSQIQKQKSFVYKKRHNISPLLIEEDFNNSNDNDQRNITSNFKRQVKKNLIMIKKQKEYRKKQAERSRYNTPRLIFQSQPTSEKQLKHSQHRLVTQDDSVFKKLNNIIVKSHTNSIKELDESRAISYSSYMNNKNPLESLKKLVSNKKIQDELVKRSRSQKKQLFKGRDLESQIKHEGNYQEWRRLSIQSDGSKKINYKVSSFETQAARLQKIRNKNQLSLKKYFQGKSYLQKLANYRQSSDLRLYASREKLN